MDHQVYFNDHEFIPLAHPAESYELQKLGVKEENALVQGRVYWQDDFVCLDCHSITTKRKLRLPDYFGKWRGRNEQVTEWAVVIAGATIMFFLNWPIWIVILALLPLLIIFDLVVSSIAKRKARRAAERLEGQLRAKGMVHEDGLCHHCGGRRLVDYLRFVSKQRKLNGERAEPMRCPKCDQVQLYHDDDYCVIA